MTLAEHIGSLILKTFSAAAPYLPAGAGALARLSNQMRQPTTLLLMLALLMPTAAARQKGRDKAQGGTRAADVARSRAEAAQRRAQAVVILKGVVEGASEIPETQSRVTIISNTLDLLWKHDEAYARANFVKAADSLSEGFAAGETRAQERSEIRAAIRVLLKAFARRDPRAAGRMLDQFQKLLEDVLKSGAGSRLSPFERLSPAQAGLDSDPAQSVALAAKELRSRAYIAACRSVL